MKELNKVAINEFRNAMEYYNLSDNNFMSNTIYELIGEDFEDWHLRSKECFTIDDIEAFNEEYETNLKDDFIDEDHKEFNNISEIWEDNGESLDYAGKLEEYTYRYDAFDMNILTQDNEDLEVYLYDKNTEDQFYEGINTSYDDVKDALINFYTYELDEAQKQYLTNQSDFMSDIVGEVKGLYKVGCYQDLEDAIINEVEDFAHFDIDENDQLFKNILEEYKDNIIAMVDQKI